MRQVCFLLYLFAALLEQHLCSDKCDHYNSPRANRPLLISEGGFRVVVQRGTVLRYTTVLAHWSDGLRPVDDDRFWLDITMWGVFKEAAHLAAIGVYVVGSRHSWHHHNVCTDVLIQVVHIYVDRASLCSRERCTMYCCYQGENLAKPVA